MKKILKTILAVLCVTAIILTAGEYPDGSVGLWNFCWLAVAFASAYGLKKMYEKKTFVGYIKYHIDRTGEEWVDTEKCFAESIEEARTIFLERIKHGKNTELVHVEAAR